MGEYVANRAAVRAGLFMSDEVVTEFMISAAVSTGEAAVPLESLAIWAGHIGFLAVQQLVERSPNGVASLKIVCEEVGFGADIDQAFKTAFGVTRSQFYEDFEPYRMSLAASLVPPPPPPR